MTGAAGPKNPSPWTAGSGGWVLLPPAWKLSEFAVGEAVPFTGSDLCFGETILAAAELGSPAPSLSSGGRQVCGGECATMLEQLRPNLLPRAGRASRAQALCPRLKRQRLQLPQGMTGIYWIQILVLGRMLAERGTVV